MSDWMNRWEDFQRSAGACLHHLKAEELLHVSHISLTNRYLYIETPKIACSTIKRTLITNEFNGIYSFEHPEYIHFREFSPLLNARQVGGFGDFLQKR